ncbi:MAG: protein-disulfide reductase DsbD [Melioribacteraceae bacterium]|nr:protein-disulfide reductase DsbD [Melioribacteraceae bacterium]
MKVFAKLFLFLSIIISISAQPNFDEELVAVKSYLSFDKVHAGSELKFALKGKVSDTWHINSNKPNDDFLIPTTVELQHNDFKLENVVYPKVKEYQFGFSDKPVAVYEGEITIAGIIKIPENVQINSYIIPIVFTYQACNDVTCMPPNSIVDTLEITVVDNQTQINEINSEIFSNIDLSYTQAGTVEENDSAIEGILESNGIILGLIFVFLGGLALNLTPCVYPLIPITVGYFGGQSEGRTSKLFLLGLLYVLGMALTYSVVGVITALSGAVFGALLQNPIVILVIAGIFIALSLSMFGVYEFKMPDSWVQKAGGAKSGAYGAFFMGLTMGIVAAPCIGPFVIGLVTYVAAKGDPYFGFMIFFVMALGLGAPYLVLALFSGKIKSLPRAGMWMEAVKHIFGFILLGMAIYFLNPILPDVLSTYLLPAFMIIASVYIMFFDKSAAGVKGFKIFKSVLSILIFAAAVYFIWPSEKISPDWQEYSDDAYQSALDNNQKIMIDFYADWCIPCKELDALTFSDERVIEKSKEFVSFKVDMTKTMSERTEQIRNKFKILGMPTVLLIDSKGNEIERLTGFVNADEFLKLMNAVK